MTGLVNPTNEDVFIGIGLAVPIDVAGGGAGLPPVLIGRRSVTHRGSRPRTHRPRPSAMERVLYEVKKVIVGQDHLLERMVVGAARARPPARRGRAGPGQDDGDQDAGRVDRRRLQAHPVHAGPGAGGPRRDAHLQPEDRRVHHLARPGLHEPAARRRDQPRPGQGPERAARGDAGAPGHDRPRDAQGARARSWCWRRRTRSRPRAPTRCPRRRSTGSCSRCWSATPRRPRSS